MLDFTFRDRGTCRTDNRAGASRSIGRLVCPHRQVGVVQAVVRGRLPVTRMAVAARELALTAPLSGCVAEPLVRTLPLTDRVRLRHEPMAGSV